MDERKLISLELLDNADIERPDNNTIILTLNGSGPDHGVIALTYRRLLGLDWTADITIHATIGESRSVCILSCSASDLPGVIDWWNFAVHASSTQRTQERERVYAAVSDDLDMIMPDDPVNG